MVHDRHCVSRQADVQLNRICAKFKRKLEGLQTVFWGILVYPAMGDDLKWRFCHLL